MSCSWLPGAASGCPSGEWKQRVAPQLHRHGMILVNAGANKGYAVAEFFRRFVGHEGPTAAEWRANLTSVKRNLFLPCGFRRSVSMLLLPVAKLCNLPFTGTTM